ncbi:Succinyl-CoA:(R)-benzylsuccinate CoA-transferase subunit BbsF [bacterium HR10]|nr:Succinyl-CoA:(R)-benzylsuccinate CoA-transferase subunit BbsF [bacterium HR10]
METGRRDALEGVKVVEFGGYAAGPFIGKYLANFGATVVHVESKERPDGFRLQYPPFKDDRIGINRSGCFTIHNDSKYGITLNLKHPEGKRLAYRLVQWADIVIENMRPGVMARLGLDFQTLCRVNPRLVMLSTSNMGQTGPWALHPGFGSQLSSYSGFTNLVGEPDGPPQLIYGPYVDYVAVGFGGVAVLAALDYSRRTGQAVYIDLSQYEAGVHFISPALLDYEVSGRIAHREGNRDPVAVPHGCFPCRDGQWCAISCWDDQEWERLAHAVGHPEWCEDPRFRTAPERKRHEAELHRRLAEWTKEREARDVMWHLQRHGVHAACVNTMKDLFSDPQLLFRRVWQEHEHPEMGRVCYRMVSYQLSETPGFIRRGAPCLGQDTRTVFIEMLGLSEREFEDLQEKGVFE